MISWGSEVRIKDSGLLGVVSHIERDGYDDKDASDCIYSVELLNTEKIRGEWEILEFFREDLVEVVEAEGPERQSVCSDFEFICIENDWREDEPRSDHYTMWVVAENEGATVWMRQGYVGSVAFVAHLTPTKLRNLRESVNDVSFYDWERYFSQDNYCGGISWRITFIRGCAKASSGGTSAYPENLKPLCKAFRRAGLPITFRSKHGLVFEVLSQIFRVSVK